MVCSVTSNDAGNSNSGFCTRYFYLNFPRIQMVLKRGLLPGGRADFSRFSS